jgi:hypothetical protein
MTELSYCANILQVAGLPYRWIINAAFCKKP